MRKIFLLNSVVLLLFVSSCTKPEDKAIDIVRNFFNEFYENGADKYGGSLKKSREVLDYSFVTTEMEKLIKNHFVMLPEKDNYQLTAERKTDDSVVVTSIGKANGPFGNIVEVRNQFLIKKIDGIWKITDSYNLIGYYLNFQVEDTQWQTYWDNKKSVILSEVIDNLKLEIISKGKPTYSGRSREGELRLVNNSDYDVKNIEILIEHFDKNGISVNTDNEYVNDVIRSKGYREFDWYTSDCSKCSKQEFKIKYVLETIK